MKLLRNIELQRELWAILTATAVFTGLGLLISWHTALLVLACGACFAGLHIAFSCHRYREIAELSASIDRILHGQEELLFADSVEGELAILRSEIQKMVIRLRDSAEQLQADKARLTDMIADISHQLRTPLTTLNLTSTLLQEEALPPERRLQLTYELKIVLQRMDWLVESLLKLSRLDAGTVHFANAPIAVSDLVRAAIKPFAIPMELRGQELRLSIQDEQFCGDFSWCEEALGNLLKNCMEHTPEGGTIYLSAMENGIYTELTVQDTGSGFDAEDLPHLFERFYKGKNASASSIGIGLALARTVITAQNGTIRASNHPAGGALFTVRFYKSTV